MESKWLWDLISCEQALQSALSRIVYAMVFFADGGSRWSRSNGVGQLRSATGRSPTNGELTTVGRYRRTPDRARFGAEKLSFAPQRLPVHCQNGIPTGQRHCARITSPTASRSAASTALSQGTKPLSR